MVNKADSLCLRGRSDGMRDGEDIYFFSSYSLYLPGKVVNLKACRFARSGDKLYFSWRWRWDREKNENIHRVLEYDLISSKARFFRCKDARRNLGSP